MCCRSTTACRCSAGLGYADSEQKIALVNVNDPATSLSIDDQQPTIRRITSRAQYDWDRVAVRLGYEKYDFDGDVDVDETSVTFFYKL